MAALVTGRPQLAVLATPFALLVAIALAGEPLALEGELRLDRDRVLEGDRLRATLAVDNRGGGARVDVHLPAAARLDSDPTPIGFWLARGERRELTFELAARRWGVHDVGPAIVRASDRLGATTIDGPLGEAADVRVYAGVQRLRSIVAPLRTRPVLGSQVSRERGEGIEFADLRPLAPGDRVRSINWRATARRRAPYVNVQHPEHSADLVLFLDTFAEAQLARRGNARRGGARRRGARLHLSRPARPRGAREPRRGAELAHRQPRHAAAVSHPRRAVLQRGAAELPVEGRHASTAPAAPGAGPGDRADAHCWTSAGSARCSTCAPAGTTSSSSRSRRSETRGATTSRSVSGGFNATRCARVSRRSAFRSRAGSPRTPASSWRSRR